MDIDLLNWWVTFINFLILAYISINIVNSQCFDVFQTGLSIIGLVGSILVLIISIVLSKT